MNASSNGINTDGSSCNVGNALSGRPSIRLLPFGVASNSGDAVKNALFGGWGGGDVDPLVRNFCAFRVAFPLRVSSLRRRRQALYISLFFTYLA